MARTLFVTHHPWERGYRPGQRGGGPEREARLPLLP